MNHSILPPEMYKSSSFSVSSQTFSIICLSYYNHPSECVSGILLRFWFAFNYWLIMLNIFACVFGHVYIFFGQTFIQIFCTCFHRLFVICWRVVKLLIYSISKSLRFMICKYSFKFCELSFDFLDNILWIAKVLILMISSLLSFSLLLLY